MGEPKKNKVIGYYTEDESIYCTECIHKNIEIMKKVDQMITADESESVYFCDGCGKEMRRKGNSG